MVSKAYKNPQGSMPWRVFLFHGVSNGFTESQAFAGTFAGICEIRKPTYQQFRQAGSYWPSSSRDLVNKHYNLKSTNGPLSEAWKEFIFAAVNKWRTFVGLPACNALDQNNSFFRTRRKTIHQAVNPQLGNRAVCKQLAVARAYISTEKGDRPWAS